MGDYVVIGLVGILVNLMSILPKSVYNAITYVFSMHKNGIRKIRKYNSTTDSIANLLIGVSIVFCIFYCFIPFYSILYAIFFMVSYLCMLAQANRVTSRKTQSVARTVLFLTNLFAGVSFLGALGFLNHHMSDAVIAQFMIDFKRIRCLIYYICYKSNLDVLVIPRCIIFVSTLYYVVTL